MKYVKLQTDILKAADKRDRGGNKLPFMCGIYEGGIYGDFIGLIVDNCYLVLIRKDHFYLDPVKIFRGAEPVNIGKFIRNAWDALPVEDTGVMRTLQDGRKVKVFTTGKDDIYVDEKCLKYFDLDDSSFRATDKKSPVYIYEYDLTETLVGMVLPINY